MSAKDKIRFINNDAAVAEICEQLKCAQIVAVDTEFINFEADKRSGHKLCLIQMAMNEAIFVIDPLNCNVGALKDIFGNPKIKKIFHSAYMDLEILRASGLVVDNYYDTQLAEMFLSTQREVSYQFLVQKYLNKSIAKGETLSDWSARPLSKKQMIYATNDVLYLNEIFLKQQAQLAELNRIGWLDEDLEHMRMHFCEEKESAEDFEESTMHNLLKLRKKMAEEKSIRPDNVVKNVTLHTLYRKGFYTIKRSRLMKRHAHLKEFIERAEASIKISKNSTNANFPGELLHMLIVLLNICGNRNGICPTLIANKDNLKDFMKKHTENSEDYSSIKFMHGWRHEIFGQYALKLLAGSIKLYVNKNEAEFE